MSSPPASSPHDHLWRSLAERHDPESLRELVAREFPTPPEMDADQATRRQFLRTMGASLALAGVQGCDTRQPVEPIVPYVQQPEQLVPGKPLYYATAMEHDQASIGLLAECHMSRPTKIEGNPSHPTVPEIMRAANEGFSDRERIRFGATNAFAQASVLSLYDPERSQVVKYLGRIHRWEGFVSALAARLDALRGDDGAGLCVLTETVLSPTMLAQFEALQQRFPPMQWFQWEPIHRDTELLGSRLAFGRDVQPLYNVREADVIVALDMDFLGCAATTLEDTHGFAERRQVAGDADDEMNRLYVLESAYTLTGAKADHRLAVRPHEVGQFARLLATELGLEAGQPDGASERLAKWARVIADDLREVRERGGTSLLLAGRWQAPAVHALIHWMNDTLGNVGRSVTYVPPVGQSALQVEQIESLTNAMRAGEVETLLILGGNPVYSAPADLDFAAALSQVPFTVHLSLYEDETSAVCHWHIPQTHFLESWSDTQAADGTASVVQPMIEPLYAGRTAHEFLALLQGQTEDRPFQLVQQYWRARWDEQPGEAASFEMWWKQALHDGVIEGTAHQPVETSLRSELAAELDAAAPAAPVPDSERPLVAVFRPDSSVWDGRYANNAWLQELPRAFTKITWDNAALISVTSARELGLVTGDVIDVTAGERTVRIPVWVLPGQPDGVVELNLGYGRVRVGEVGTGVGTNVYPLRTTEGMWFATVAIRETDETHAFATTQEHHLIDGYVELGREALNRHIVRHGTLEEYLQDPEHPPFVHPPHAHAPDPETTLYPVPEYQGYKWGMSIDLTKCIGCNGCVVACQAENNIPVVGKEQVAAGREMHWLRIDHYFDGDLHEPESYHQPMLCQHCEYAPCEVVCPVYATTHSSEGLNEMTYNRCVGTRYCSNNCPYKVRRFNYFDYNAPLRELPILQLLPNPDVTVRSRGVMEKCTFCVQRINSARIHAEKEERGIHDGEVVTACQAACPSEAIVFGDLNDETSRVHELSASPLGYGVLEDLNTRPRITYLAALKHRNPALTEGVTGDAHE